MPLNFQDDLFSITKDQKKYINIKRYLKNSNLKKNENELEECIEIDCKSASSESFNETGLYDYAFDHSIISKAASDDWVAAIPRIHKQVISNEFYSNKLFTLKGVELIHWGIHTGYPSFSQLLKNTSEILSSFIELCFRQTQTPAYQTGHIVKSMLWSGVYIWATTKMYRKNNNDPWNFKRIPEIYYFFESTFLWMLSYDYVIGIFAGAITIILTHAGAIFTIESPSEKEYDSLFDYLYYSVVTIGTVGYGDFSPRKREGRLATIIVITLTLILLPHEFQRLKEALNTPPDSIGSFIRKNDTYLCIIGPIPPKQLLFITKSLSLQKQRRFKSIVLLTPIQILEYQNIVKISQQRGYIRLSIKQGFLGSAINNLVQCSSIVLIYGSEKQMLHDVICNNRTNKSDFDALITAMCLTNLLGLKDKFFLIFYSSQVASLSKMTGVLGSLSLENLRIKLLSKCISNCPGFLPIMLHLIIPKNENMLRKLQEPPKNTFFTSNIDRSKITPYEWKCRWRGLHFKVYTLRFPSSFFGYPIQIFTKYIYKHLGIFLIGVYCPDTNRTYLNPHQYIIGDNSNVYYEGSNYLGIVLSSSISLVKKAELLESPKNYTEEFIKKVGRRSCSPSNVFLNRSKKFKSKECIENKDQLNIYDCTIISEIHKHYDSNDADKNIQISQHNREFTNSIHYSSSYDDQRLFDQVKNMILPNQFEETASNMTNINSKLDICKINSNTVSFSQSNVNFLPEINTGIPVVSNYLEAISKIFTNREHPIVLIIGWCGKIDMLIKLTFSLKPSNFILLCEKIMDLPFINDEFFGKIAQISGVGTSEHDLKQAGALIASRIIIFDSTGNPSNIYKEELINVRYGKHAIGTWITICYLFSKYKKKDNCLVGSQKMPPLIIDIKETDIGLLLFQYSDDWSTRIDGSTYSIPYKNELDFFYSRQFLSGQFFVDNIIDSLIPFLVPILDNNPINKSFINQIIYGKPTSKPFGNVRYNNEKNCSLQMEEIPFVFANSTFYNLFSQLLKHGRLAIGIYRPIRVDDFQFNKKQDIKTQKFFPSFGDLESVINENSVKECFNCETHLIISCPPPKFKINLGDYISPLFFWCVHTKVKQFKNKQINMWGFIEQLRSKAGGFIDLSNGIICCAAFGSLLLIFRKYIPHPSEFFPFSWFFLKFGIHKHENFNLLLDILEGVDIPETGKYSIRIKCGRETDESSISICLEDASKFTNNLKKTFKCSWKEKRIIFVRQRENYLFIELISHGTFTSSVIGECRISIMDIIDAKFPKKVTYGIQKDRKVVAKLLLSFYRISANIIVEDTNPVLFQAMINLQTDADISGNKSIYADFDKMSEKEQLIFFSKALQGNLYYLENGDKDKLRMFYFRAVEVTINRWEWCYWATESDYLKGSSKLGGYPFLAMSVVIPDKTDRDQIYIKYHDLYGIHDLFFRAIEIDRDVWSEAIYEFIERLRSYLDHIKDGVINTEQLNIHLENADLSNSPSEQPFIVNLNSRDGKPTDSTQHEITSEKDKETTMIEPRAKNSRTVKIHIKGGSEKHSKNINSPNSIKRMKMEVNPPRYENEPLI
ncbi:Ion channel family protein [Cryptosporidium meleagridis]|uniref:Ion channel family protein n=1 Tax=Cryptosporidium meleagridis TaxID=93969 RepID=A0A2P4Z3E9_9CRYT|nr:Ion channel family protein [Cryptosporidium meleagridis]